MWCRWLFPSRVTELSTIHVRNVYNRCESDAAQVLLHGSVWSRLQTVPQQFCGRRKLGIQWAKWRMSFHVARREKKNHSNRSVFPSAIQHGRLGLRDYQVQSARSSWVCFCIFLPLDTWSLRNFLQGTRANDMTYRTMHNSAAFGWRALESQVDRHQFVNQIPHSVLFK